jgi:hypothetical protein
MVIHRDVSETGNLQEKWQNFTATVSRENQSHARCTYKRNIEAHSCNHNYRGKAIRITHSEYVSVTLGTQHAKSMRRNYIATAACPAVPRFSTVSHKRHDFRGVGGTEHEMCVLIFPINLSTTFLILSQFR